MKTKLRELLRQSRVTKDGFFPYELDKLTTEILSLVKECAPHQFDTNYNAETVDQRKIKQYEMGWNENGKQFLANIEGEK